MFSTFGRVTGSSTSRHGRGVQAAPTLCLMLVRTLATLLVTVVCHAPIVYAQGETVEYYGYDAIGSVRVVFSAAGAVIGRGDYLPFGEEWSPAPGLPAQRFTGQERDGEEGLDHFNARRYHTRTGRFTTTDPVFAGPFDPQAWNRYAYAYNNPLAFVDPTGMLANACTPVVGKIEVDGKTYDISDGGCVNADPIGGGWSAWFDFVWNFFSPPVGAPEADYFYYGPRPTTPSPTLPDPGTDQNAHAIDTTGPIIEAVAAVTSGGTAPAITTVAKNITKQAAKQAGKDFTKGTGPWGRKGNPMANAPYQPTRNSGTVIGGRDYSGHALDRMQDRGIPPSVVENTIRYGSAVPSGGGTLYRDAVNSVSVVTNQSGRVITVMPGTGNWKP